MKTFKTLLIAAILVGSASLSASAQSPWNQRYQDYINRYKDVAIQEMQRYGIPASITLAQGLLESGAGQSELCRKGNNHFGIKCHEWSGRTIYHDDDESQECFRAYNSALESFEDHSRFLAEKPRYKRLFSLSRTDYKGWARGLKECGYATNPQYANSLIGIIETYQLHQYDRATGRHHHTGGVADSVANEHPIHAYNKNFYLYARSGDTFKSLAAETGVSARRLARYNELDRKHQLSEGEVVYLEKKQTRALKDFKNRPHVVRAGDSMHSIAQMYGIRLKSLYQKNGLSPDYMPRVGDRLRVY
jgi:hypothetical protein